MASFYPYFRQILAKFWQKYFPAVYIENTPNLFIFPNFFRWKLFSSPTRAPFEIKLFQTNPPTSSVRNFPPSEVPSEAPSEECVESKGKGKSKGGKSKGKGGKSKGCKSKGKGGKSKGGKSKSGSKSGSKGTKSKHGSKGTKSKNGSKSGNTNVLTTTDDRDSPLDGFKTTKSSSSGHRKRTKAKHRKAKLSTRRFLEDDGHCVDLLIDVSIVLVFKIVLFPQNSTP